MHFPSRGIWVVSGLGCFEPCCACLRGCMCKSASLGGLGPPLPLFCKSSEVSPLPSVTQVTPTDFLQQFTQPTAAQSRSPGIEKHTGCGTCLQGKTDTTTATCREVGAPQGPALLPSPQEELATVLALGVASSLSSYSWLLWSDSGHLCRDYTKSQVRHLSPPESPEYRGSGAPWGSPAATFSFTVGETVDLEGLVIWNRQSQD